MPPKWKLCLLLFVTTTLNYLDRQTVGILAPFLQKDLGLDNKALGWLFAAFYYSYTAAQFLIGGLLDRSNLRWAYAAGIVAWSSVVGLTALVSGFGSLLVCRLLLGATESVNWPAAMRMVARSMPPHERSLGNGIFTSGSSVGALVAPIVILGIARWLDWRWAFAIVGAAGMIWCAIWLRATRHRVYALVWRGGSDDHQTGSQAYREVLSTGHFWRVFAVSILVNPCLYFLLNWLPTFLSQQRGVTPDKLQWTLTLMYLGLDLGYLFCGAAVLGLTKMACPLGFARRTVFWIATLLLSSTALVPYAGTLDGTLALLTAANFGAGCWIAMYLTMAQEVSTNHIATAAGLLGGSGSLAGAFAMWAVGHITQETSSFSGPLFGIAFAAVIAALAGNAVVRGAWTGQERDRTY